MDTHVVVRLLVGDDAGQAEKSRSLFDAAAERRERLWIGDAVAV